jgi:hypothetical protein
MRAFCKISKIGNFFWRDGKQEDANTLEGHHMNLQKELMRIKMVHIRNSPHSAVQ